MNEVSGIRTEADVIRDLAKVLDLLAPGIVVVADFTVCVKSDDGTWVDQYGDTLSALDVADRHGPYDIQISNPQSDGPIDWEVMENLAPFIECEENL